LTKKAPYKPYGRIKAPRREAIAHLWVPMAWRYPREQS
jgi:hypothetical protein